MAADLAGSPGTSLTVELAESLGRPLLVARADAVVAELSVAFGHTGYVSVRDGRDVLSDPDAHTAARRAVEAGVDTQLLFAERGLLDEPQGLYDEARLRELELPAGLRTSAVAGSNHYSVILQPTAITALADAVEGQLATR